METEILPVELMENIFSRVSLKALSRMKCVTKSWYAIISNLRRTVPRTTSLGLVILTYPYPDERHGHISASLLLVQEQARRCTVQGSYPLNLDEREPFLLDSCNGLLLCGSGYFQRANVTLYVISPILHQFRALPLLDIKRNTWQDDLIFAGMTFCGSQENFKVITRFGRIDPRSSTEAIDFHIFESEKWEWRLHCAKVVPISPFVYDPMEEIYLKWDRRMLIYNFQKGVVKFVQLPPSINGLLWVSEASLYYGTLTLMKGNILKLNIWRYEADNQAYINDDDDQANNKWRWKKMSFPRRKLQVGRMNLADHDVELLAFNDDLQILYLGVRKHDIILAYSFENGNLWKVLGVPFTIDTLEKHEKCEYGWEDDCLPFMFSPVSIPNAG